MRPAAKRRLGAMVAASRGMTRAERIALSVAGEKRIAAAARARRAVQRLRRDALALEQEFEAVIRATFPALKASVRNLLHYLAVRQHDIRALQNDLAMLGVSSLGRLEAHTLASLDAVLKVLGRVCARQDGDRSIPAAPCSIEEGSAKLARHAAAMLGPSPPGRNARIMVTMPSEAATDPVFIRKLLQQGMNIMRINCAHDGRAEWRLMVDHLRAAERKLGRQCLISFDLAGPKPRTGPIQPGPRVVKWRPSRNKLGKVLAPARIRFCSAPKETQSGETVIPVAGKLVAKARAGDRIRLEDARGRRRSLRVIDVADSCCVCEARKTAYVVPGTRLALRRGARTVARDQVAALPALAETIQLRSGDLLEIVKGDAPGRPAVLDELGRTTKHAVVSCTLPEVFRSVHPGQRVFLDDGRISGAIGKVGKESFQVKIASIIGGAAKLGGEKGINLPDTDLKMAALTAKDREDLAFIARHGDMVAMSFVQRPEDINDLLAELRRLNAARLGIVLKIETRQAFSKLPALLISTMRRPLAAVMVARGDLGVEVGFERLSEVQEEILWLCEAAHIPVVWATQVLESLAKGGMPSRAEVTDAAMGSRAECVMLNKGPYILRTLRFLRDVLTRMEAHQSKKTPLLRRLMVSDLHLASSSAARAAAKTRRRKTAPA